MSLTFGILVILTAIVLIILLTSVLRFNAFLSLFVVSLFVAIVTLPLPDIVPVLKKGFGDTMNSIGLIIIFGSIIGVLLDISNATTSIANYLLKLTGDKKAPLATSLTGFISGLTIYCDSGFIVLSGLNRSVTAKSKFHPVVMASVLAGSLYGVHNLIPPHPGATAAAGILDVNVGKLILAGILTAVVATAAGIAWVFFISKKIKLSDGNSMPDPQIDEKNKGFDGNLPSVGHALFPIALPILLITISSVVEILFPGDTSPFSQVIKFAGDPVIALMLGMFAGFSLIPQNNFKNNLDKFINSAIEKAGPIIIVTAGGGLFGAVIKSTGVGEQVGVLLSETGMGLLIPFIIAFVLKTAQGSSTIAIITAASIIAPMLDSLGFSGEWDKILVILSMGAGAMMISHANDSYFWVITKFSGLEVKDSLKVYSTMTIAMGLSTLLVVLALAGLS